MSIRFGRSGNGYDSSEVMETEDDDWRKVTDLNERRKIQNRLAQRNYRRKLRQRLEQLERQAGENGAANTGNTETSNPNSKRRKRQLPTEASNMPGKTGVKYTERNTARKVSNLEERSSTKSPAESLDNRSTESAPRNLYTGDFGPLFTNVDIRQRGTRQPDQQLPIWPQPYLQQQESYDQDLAQHPYYASPPPSFPITPTSHIVSSEPPPSPSQQLQAYISLLPNDPPLPVSSSLTQRGEASPPSTHTSFRPNANMVPGIDPPGFPDLSPAYSANPSINSNPYHLNGTLLPTDSFYLTLNYSTLFNATMEIAKILQVPELDMTNDDTISPFNRNGSASPLQLPENIDELEPTKKQLEIPHHPYIDTVPFKGFRDKLLEYVKNGDETGNYEEEAKICIGMYETWGVWGQVPWEARSWEIGEVFARKYWFLMDEEMVKCSNWWRRQRGMKPFKLQELRKAAGGVGRVIGEVE